MTRAQLKVYEAIRRCALQEPFASTSLVPSLKDCVEVRVIIPTDCYGRRAPLRFAYEVDREGNTKGVKA